MPGRRGAIIPETIDPPEEYRRVICVPGSPDWLALVNGALWVLTQSWYWDGSTGDVQAVTARAQQMYFEFQDENGGCDNVTIPVGVIMGFGSGMLPDGWLYCNGDEVLKTSYPDLYDAITNTWGTPTLGSDYFVLPDFRNRSLFGFQYGGSPLYPIGSYQGALTHTLTTAQIPAHSHTTYAPELYSTAQAGAGTAGIGGAIPNAGIVTGNTGGGSAHNNLHPVAVCGVIIYAGV